MGKWAVMGILLLLSLVTDGCSPSLESKATTVPTPIIAYVKTPTPRPVTIRPVAPVTERRTPPKRGPYSTMTVIIDPGHGGEDLGAKSLGKPVYSEKNFNLVAARFLQDHLDQMGFHTVMTREKDLFVALDDRAKIATRRDSEIFVSVHFNAAQSPDADGIEVFYYDAKEHPGRTAQSKALANAVLARVIAATEGKSRGAKHGNYHVIRETAVPAILIEGGFLTNADELEKIKNPIYLKKMMWGAAQGINDYIKQK